MLIQYVGAKPEKTDNVAGTGLVWLPGQAHEVNDPAAIKKLLAYPGVWREVSSEKGAPKVEKVEILADAYAGKTLEELRALCDGRGIKYHPNAKEASLIEKLSA